MIYLPEIKDELTRALQAIQNNRALLTKYPKTTGSDDKRITAENLEDLVGNHMFNNRPECFGITELEGHRIRSYFQGSTKYNFVAELHQEYPDVIEEERPEYLDKINRYRTAKGLEPISPKNLK